jgi:DNA-binding IclR family transcriptional regulator
MPAIRQALQMSTGDPHLDVIDADTERKYRAPALEKGLDILELLARHSQPMSLSQISAALDRSPSELFRMVQVLEFKGYIAPVATGDGFILTNKLFALGMAQAPTRTLLEAALPVMRRLAERIGQSCHLAVASDDQIAVVARVEAPGDIGLSVRVGYRRSLVAATSGLCLFAFQPEAVQREWLARLFQGSPESARTDFVKRAEAARAQGFVRANSDFVHGVIDLSTPVLSGHAAVAGLTVPFVHRVPLPCTLDEATPHVRAAAAEISADLGESV